MYKVILLTKSGLTSYHIKWIALVFMTVDHLGAYGFEIPIFAAHYNILRILGRIAAPLFLFMIAESARHTRSKPRFIIRLYFAGVFTGLFVTATNFFFCDTIGTFSSGNMFFTFFYTVLYIYLIEQIIASIKSKDKKHLITFVLSIFASCIPHFLWHFFYWFDLSQLQLKQVFLLQDLIDSFVPSPLSVEYSLVFILLGIMLYFVNTKKRQCLVFVCFCVICYVGGIAQRFIPWSFNEFFGSSQFWMVLALPFMILYNGKRGKEHKQFFYIYYPVHRYLISIISFIIVCL